jgi:hypothetical protein
VYVTAGSITSGGAGAVKVTGVGGSAGAPSGNDVFGPPGGSFDGQASAGLNDGVAVCNAGTITSGGTGSVTVTGTGGSGGFGEDLGVDVAEGTVSSGGGDVAITGTGGTGGLDDIGVLVSQVGVVKSGGGAVTITGAGGDPNPLHDPLVTVNRSFNFGVASEPGGLVTSGGGDVAVIGVGGDGIGSHGVAIGGTVTSGGAGAVTVTGTGGLGGECYGVAVDGNFSDTNPLVSTGTITSGGPGNITVSGTGGGYAGVADSEDGIFVGLGTIQSTGAGNITIVGTAPAPFTGNGVFLGMAWGSDVIKPLNLEAVSATGTGSVSVTGIAGLAGSGVIVNQDGIIASEGDVTITGTGGSGAEPDPNITNNNLRYGVSLTLGAVVTGGAGNIAITGTVVGNAGGSTDGVLMSQVSSVTIAGTGNITINGTGGAGGTGRGVMIASGHLLSTLGNVSVTGIAGGDGDGIDAHGVLRAGGNLTVTGAGPGAGGTAVALEPATTFSGGAQVTLIADSLAVDTSNLPATIQAGAAGDGTVLIQTRTAGTQIDLGGPDVLSGTPLTLGLTAAELARIKAGILQIGDATTTGAIAISAAIDFGATAEVDLTASGPISETAQGAVKVAGLNLTTTAGAINLDQAGNQIGTVTASAGGAGNGLALKSANGVVIGPVGGVSGIDAGGSILIAAPAGTIELGAEIQAGGGVFAGDVVLLGNVALTDDVRVEGKAVAFAGSLDGGSSLTAVAGNLLSFAGAVGAKSPLASLVVVGPAAVNGGSVTTIGGQTFFSPVQVGRDTAFASTTGGDLTFASLAGDHVVTADTAGATHFGGPVTVRRLITRQPVVVAPGLPDGQVGTAFNQPLSASGPVGPYTFAVTGGTLPAGLSLSSTGVLSGIPVTSGSFTFIVTATNALRQSGSQTLTIAIASASAAPVTVVPVGRDVQVATSESVPVTALIPVTDANGGALAYQLVVAPAHGTVVFQANDTFTYTPAANWSGTDTFGVRGTAPDGAFAQAQVTVAVPAVNDGPVIVLSGLKPTVRENAAARFTAVALHAYGPRSAVRFGLEDAPAGAWIQPVTGVFHWTPTKRQGPRSDTFAVTATDANGISRAQVTLTVTGANHLTTRLFPGDHRRGPSGPVGGSPWRRRAAT